MIYLNHLKGIIFIKINEIENAMNNFYDSFILKNDLNPKSHFNQLTFSDLGIGLYY